MHPDHSRARGPLRQQFMQQLDYCGYQDLTHSMKLGDAQMQYEDISNIWI